MPKKLSWLLLLIIAVLLLLAPFASDLPDGLERVAHDLGFIKQDKTGALLSSPFAGYSIPWVENRKLSKALAGAVGVIMVVLISWGLAYRRSSINDSK
jgi:hypothetical protein